jgi:hypothetical protein
MSNIFSKLGKAIGVIQDKEYNDIGTFPILQQYKEYIKDANGSLIPNPKKKISEFAKTFVSLSTSLNYNSKNTIDYMLYEFGALTNINILKKNKLIGYNVSKGAYKTIDKEALVEYCKTQDPNSPEYLNIYEGIGKYTVSTLLDIDYTIIYKEIINEINNNILIPQEPILEDTPVLDVKNNFISSNDTIFKNPYKPFRYGKVYDIVYKKGDMYFKFDVNRYSSRTLLEEVNGEYKTRPAIWWNYNATITGARYFDSNTKVEYGIKVYEYIKQADGTFVEDDTKQSQYIYIERPYELNNESKQCLNIFVSTKIEGISIIVDFAQVRGDKVPKKIKELHFLAIVIHRNKKVLEMNNSTMAFFRKIGLLAKTSTTQATVTENANNTEVEADDLITSIYKLKDINESIISFSTNLNNKIYKKDMLELYGTLYNPHDVIIEVLVDDSLAGSNTNSLPGILNNPSLIDTLDNEDSQKLYITYRHDMDLFNKGETRDELENRLRFVTTNIDEPIGVPTDDILNRTLFGKIKMTLGGYSKQIANKNSFGDYHLIPLEFLKNVDFKDFYDSKPDIYRTIYHSRKVVEYNIISEYFFKSINWMGSIVTLGLYNSLGDDAIQWMGENPKVTAIIGIVVSIATGGFAAPATSGLIAYATYAASIAASIFSIYAAYEQERINKESKKISEEQETINEELDLLKDAFKYDPLDYADFISSPKSHSDKLYGDQNYNYLDKIELLSYNSNNTERI